jgi:hypothetical protein
VHFVIIPASVVRKLARKKRGDAKNKTKEAGGAFGGVLAEHFLFVRFVRLVRSPLLCSPESYLQSRQTTNPTNVSRTHQIKLYGVISARQYQHL